jgi:hypothetical protein
VLPDPLAIIGMFMLGASAGALVTHIKDRNTVREARNALCQETKDDRDTAVESKSYLGIKALIVGHDPEMTSIFSHLFRERGIEAQKCFSESSALEQLALAKFQALVVDCDEIGFASRKSFPRPNEQVLVIAVATDGNPPGAPAGVSFVIKRPLTPQQVREVLRAAYGRMLRDGQQYFTLTVELPVSIRQASGTLLQGTTLNLSQTGMAVKSPSSLTAGEVITICFAVPNTDIFVSAEGKVIWDDKHGKTGISFQCDSASAQSRYYEWLHDHFFMMQSDVTLSITAQQEQKSHVDQSLVRTIFKGPHLAYLHHRSDRLRRTGPIRNTDKTGSLLGPSPQQRDGRTY